MKYFDDSDTDCRYDVEKAKALLAEAGVSDLHLKLTCAENTNRLNEATIIQDMLAQVGITVEIQSYEAGTFYDMVDAGETEIFLIGFGAVGFPEPDNNIYGPFNSKQIPTNNMGFYSDPEMDKNLRRREIPVTDRRGSRSSRISRNICASTFLLFRLPIQSRFFGIRSNVKGFVPTPAGSHFFQNVHFENAEQ